ncbi:hypothetical protein RRG08_066036 [Elysia crispata]|uniref:Uncharacterized protein n=1 Tax=Elysia crispata TaxID=231223 RepID=A0AAE0Y2S9_9GAST|nr:hypothetical protein RRG08_066036 [Elysia crispata]
MGNETDDNASTINQSRGSSLWNGLKIDLSMRTPMLDLRSFPLFIFAPFSAAGIDGVTLRRGIKLKLGDCPQSLCEVISPTRDGRSTGQAKQFGKHSSTL